MATWSGTPYFLVRVRGEGQIRLLSVQPEADGCQEIRCELKAVHLKDSPNYVAVSYTWGHPTAEVAEDVGVTRSSTHTIRCNGDVILISQNLHDFLWRVRHDPELNSQRFWVDSICINQQDALERCNQVSFMASIYRSADMVIAWLGEEDIYTEKSFALIRALATLCQDCLKQIVPKNMGSEAFLSILGILADHRAWDSLKRFWRRSYFKRAWIIQEIALAKKVIAKCGSHLLDWGQIVRVSLFLTVTPWTRFLNLGVQDPTDRQYSNHTLPLYLDANSKMEPSGKHRTLLYALIRARRFQCSDPRDKVYALLGIEEEYVKGKSRLRPIYGDRSVVAAYVSTAIQILEDADDLLLLAQAEGQDFQTVAGLPSWVPDWSCPRAVGLGLVGYKRFAAAGNLPRSLTIDEPSTSLALRGLWLDRIVQVGESKDEALIHRKPAYFPGWVSILSALPEVYHTGQPKTEVFWRTLITDTAARNPHPVRNPAGDEYRFAFRDWFVRIVLSWINEPPSMEKRHFLEGLDHVAASDKTRFIPSVADSLDTGLGRKLLSSFSNYFTDASSSGPPDADDYDTILTHSAHTRLVRTSANYLGLATTSAREGDFIWIVPGSRVPLILREACPRNEYRLIGGAYIHGFMHGEALLHDFTAVDVKVV
ncbi:heterokaryon incompatibility protein-domain-containing protein [Xylariaceae sp. AK1471]|nr:heterokaryon incompatibility protein-domain-containing protein [Xylariaceae sp. AK1471]